MARLYRIYQIKSPISKYNQQAALNKMLVECLLNFNLNYKSIYYSNTIIILVGPRKSLEIECLWGNISCFVSVRINNEVLNLHSLGELNILLKNYL